MRRKKKKRERKKEKTIVKYDPRKLGRACCFVSKKWRLSSGHLANSNEFISLSRMKLILHLGTVSNWFTIRPLTTRLKSGLACLPHLALFKPQLAASFFLPFRPLLPFRERNNRELRPLPAGAFRTSFNEKIPSYRRHCVILCSSPPVLPLGEDQWRVALSAYISIILCPPRVPPREFNKSCLSSYSNPKYIYDKRYIYFYQMNVFIQNR